MRKSAALIVASAFVAVSSSMALAMPGAQYPGDHQFDYDPVNQAFEWHVNNDGPAAQHGRDAYASAKHVRRQPVMSPDRTTDMDSWAKARIDDESEGRGG